MYIFIYPVIVKALAACWNRRLFLPLSPVFPQLVCLMSHYICYYIYYIQSNKETAASPTAQTRDYY